MVHDGIRVFSEQVTKKTQKYLISAEDYQKDVRRVTTVSYAKTGGRSGIVAAEVRLLGKESSDREPRLLPAAEARRFR